MFKNIFRKGHKEVEQKSDETVAPVATADKKMTLSGKPSKKKKNTYVVHLNTMIMPGMHELCPATPLVVVKLNGVPTENVNGGWTTGTQFPNPGASQIEVLYKAAPEWRIIAGDKQAQTIIEYLDKETLVPVLTVYPNGHVQSLVPGADANAVIGTRLNHASRRDFARQYNRILETVQIVKPLITARNKAMERAPQYTSEAHSKFLAELNRMQIERAKQIMAQRQK